MTMQLKRGMTTFKIQDIPLKFSSYVNKAKVPLVPATFGHVHSAGPHGGWGMLGNDTKGDCTMAGIAHGDMVWNWATGSTIPLFSDAVIVKQYMHLTGGVDSGLDPVEVAQWWQSHGLVDAHGKTHKIRSFTAIDKVPDAVEAAYLFGFSGLAMWMPTTAEAQFEAGQPWDDTSGDPQQNEGHFVPLVGRNSAGNLMVVTWGRVHAATPAWMDKYFAGGVAYTSQEYMMASGLSPEGFNFDQLDADMASL
jgi:hypothetical protein